MKRKFVELSGFKRSAYRTSYGRKSSILTWYFLDFWLVTKEADKGRCINFKQLLSKLISRNGFNPS
jgi:hypothetical protein